MALRDRIAISVLLAAGRSLQELCKQKGGWICVLAGVVLGAGGGVVGAPYLQTGVAPVVGQVDVEGSGVVSVGECESQVRDVE